MKKEAILAQLDVIQKTKLAIEQRMIAGLKPVYDVQDKDKSAPLNALGIQQRTRDVAQSLMADKSVTFPVLISVMNGALPFAAGVQQELGDKNYAFQFEAIHVSSYTGTESGALSIKSHSKIPLAGRDVIVVDDVCDTGKTYEALRVLFLNQGARSVKQMVLVDKAQPRKSPDANPTYIGYTVSADEFIVGCGLDYDELLRNLAHIGAVDKATLPTDDEIKILNSEKALNDELAQLQKKRDAFEKQLEILSAEAQILRKNGKIAAADVADDLHEKMVSYSNQLFADKITEKEFKRLSHAAIDKARPELEIWGLKEVLGNLLLAVLGLGVVYLAYCAINKYTTGHFLFFRPEMAQKLDALEEQVAQVAQVVAAA